ncbi:MAG: cation:proton antiporter [Deltaproteobacteria bacterium]|nr:cation:proton antiporter [Deltaproteobacteria bacterium]
MQAARAFAPTDHVATSAGTALASGYLLLSAFLAGSIFKQIGLPRLTGYLVTGVLAGPHVSGLLSEPMVQSLRIFNGVSIALIAINAGAEMHLPTLRPLLRSVAWITLFAVVGTVLWLSIAVYLLRERLPFLAALDLVPALAVAVTLGVTMVAQSPAVVVALRDETDADGPVMRTVLAVVILADLVVILMFAGASSFAKAALGARSELASTALHLSWEIFGSFGVGAIVGFLVSLYLRKVAGGGALFTVAVCFVVAEIGQRVDLDPLLVALAAGMFIRNATEVADRLHAEIQTAAFPVHVVFFAVAGAAVHVDALQIVGAPAVALVLVRAVGLVWGTRLAARVADAPEAVGRYAGFGLLPQAGLALALAILFARTFPEFGPSAAALVVATVGLNELVAPVIYRVVIARSGESGRRARPRASSTLQMEELESSRPRQPAEEGVTSSEVNSR